MYCQLYSQLIRSSLVRTSVCVRSTIYKIISMTVAVYCLFVNDRQGRPRQMVCIYVEHSRVSNRGNGRCSPMVDNENEVSMKTRSKAKEARSEAPSGSAEHGKVPPR